MQRDAATLPHPFSYWSLTMRKALLVLPLILAVPLLAQQDKPTLPGLADAARVAAGTYAVDASHSQINWQVNHFGFNDYFGLFGDVKGTLQIDPANLSAAKVDVTITGAALGDFVLAGPNEALPTNCRWQGAYVSATDTVTFVFGSEGGNVTGAAKAFDVVVISRR
jgi:hypothetical protein